MTDPCAIRHGGNEHSTAAYASLGNKRALLNRVVDTIAAAGDHGATCWEVEQASGLSHQTASARVTEAKAKGLVIATGRTRPTGSGRSAGVYVAVPVQEALWSA